MSTAIRRILPRALLAAAVFGVLLEKDGTTVTAISIGFDGRGQASHIYILRNPDKLAGLSAGSVGSGRGRFA